MLTTRHAETRRIAERLVGYRVYDNRELRFALAEARAVLPLALAEESTNTRALEPSCQRARSGTEANPKALRTPNVTDSSRRVLLESHTTSFAGQTNNQAAQPKQRCSPIRLGAFNLPVPVKHCANGTQPTDRMRPTEAARTQTPFFACLASWPKPH